MSSDLKYEKPLESICPFGVKLCEARKSVGFPSARLSMRAEIFPSHLSNIEKGLAQPSIKVACRLVSTLDFDLVAFFKELALSQEILVKDDEQLSNHISADELMNALQCEDIKTVKSPFGLLFRQFRTVHKVTQQKVSTFTGYSIRDIQKVEKGQQDPNVMTALAMVCAVALHADICIDVFFEAYRKLAISNVI